MFDVSPEEIEHGSIPRVLLLLAAPLVAQNFALVAQSVVDLFWVGRIGSAAVAAVGVATVVIALLTVPIKAFFIGSQVVTSQRVGSDDVEGARRVPFSTAAAAVLVATVLGAAVAVLADPVVAAFGTTGAVADLAVTYLTGYSLALVATAASDTLESGFTGWGDTRAALYVNLAAIVVNLALDPFLIFGWGPFPAYGIFGAALATAVGYTFGAVVAVALATRGRHGFELTRDAVGVDIPTIREVASVGGPIAVKNSGRQVARVVIVWIVSTAGGAAALAAYYLGWQVATVAFVPAQGIAGAATSVIGQNLGAEQPDRARRATWTGVAVAAVGLTALGAVQWAYPAAVARLFVPDLSGAALAHSVDYLRILAYGYWALGSIYTLEAGFNGASRTDVSMVATLTQYWGVRLPIAAGGVYVLGVGVTAVFWAVTLSNAAAALGLAAYYRYSTDRGMLETAAESAGATPGD